MAKVLLIIPHDRFRDEEYESVLKTLTAAGHKVEVGSSHHTEAKGHFGLLVKPDIEIEFVDPKDYEAIVFIGGRGVEEYFNDSAVIELIRGFFQERKFLGALGMAVEILAVSGILTSRKVTCDTSTIPKVQAVGAYYTGKITELDGEILTGNGVEAKDEFAQDLLRALSWRKGHLGEIR